MRITEEQLYKMICESIDDILIEANNTPNINGTFNNDYQKKMKKNKSLSDTDIETDVMNYVEQGETSVAGREKQTVNTKNGWVQHGKKLGRNVGIGASLYGGAIGTAFLGAKTLGIGGLVLSAANLALPLGFGLLAMNYMKNARAMGRVSKLKLPRTLDSAYRYGKYAVSERSKAQTICLNAQQNLKNAIDGWNLTYSDTYTWKRLIGELQDAGQETKATFNIDDNNTDTVEVDFDKNFTDKYAGKNESVLSLKHELNESNTSATPDINGMTKEIKTVKEFQDICEKDEELGRKYLIVLGTLYIQSYSLWMKWTRYINQIVHKFQKKGLTWETLINYKGGLGSKIKSAAGNFLNAKLGTKIDFNSKQDNEYQPSGSIKTIKVRVVKPIYHNGRTLVQALSNNTYFSVPYKDSDMGMHINIQYSPSYITKKYVDKNYNATIYELNAPYE